MSANSSPQSIEKGGCLGLALAALGLGLWLLWPAPPVPVGSDGRALEAASARIESNTALTPGEEGVELTLRYTAAGAERVATVRGRPKSGARLEVGQSLKLLVDPADPASVLVEALGQRPSNQKPASQSTFLRILGGLAAAAGAFGLFAALTGGGGSRAPGARPGEDDRH